jgi:acetate kinase
MAMTMRSDATMLTLNGGSSSLKFAIHAVPGCNRLSAGKFDRLGTDQASFSIEDEPKAAAAGSLGQSSHREVVHYLFDWLEARNRLPSITAIGHRIVHGGKRYRRPERIDDAMVAELRQISDYAPEHLPAEIEMIEACRERLGGVPQVACFDTAFHGDLPAVARLLPIPRRFADMGIERYGFHGLSYTYLLEELRRTAGDDAAQGRLVLAHLGNGASLAAVRAGRSIDTTMGFTPAAGIPMSSRSGDLDPGLVLYLSRREGMDAERFDRMVNHQSGLLGLSETSSDVRDLLAREFDDPRAAEALAVFCYHIKKTIGAYTAALGGMDTLVFSGGIGENAPAIRERICAGLGFLGIALDAERNAGNAPLISSGAVAVRVIPTDEEAVIVRAVADILATEGSDS